MLGNITLEQSEMFVRNPRFSGLKFPDLEKNGTAGCNNTAGADGRRGKESLEKRYVGKIPKRSWMQFMKSILKMEPSERLDGRGAVQHPMFEDLRKRGEGSEAKEDSKTVQRRERERVKRAREEEQRAAAEREKQEREKKQREEEEEERRRLREEERERRENERREKEQERIRERQEKEAGREARRAAAAEKRRGGHDPYLRGDNGSKETTASGLSSVSAASSSVGASGVPGRRPRSRDGAGGRAPPLQEIPPYNPDRARGKKPRADRDVRDAQQDKEQAGAGWGLHLQDVEGEEKNLGDGGTGGGPAGGDGASVPAGSPNAGGNMILGLGGDRDSNQPTPTDSNIGKRGPSDLSMYESAINASTSFGTRRNQRGGGGNQLGGMSKLNSLGNQVSSQNQNATVASSPPFIP